MKISVLVGFFWAIALVIAGVFAVTTSTLPQSVPLIITCFASIFAFVGFRKKKLKHVHPIVWLFLVAWVYFISRALVSPVSHLARQDLFLLIPAGVIYLINAFILPSRRMRGMLVGGVLMLMLLNLLQLIPAVNEYRDQALNYAQGSTGLVKGEKFTGLYNHQNFFSNFMGMATLITLSLAIWGSFSKVRRIVLFILGIAGVVAIGLAQSRGGYLGLAGGGAVIGMMSLVLMRSGQTKGQIITKIALVFIAGIGVVIGGYKVLEKRESQAYSDKLGKFQASGRLGMFASVIDQVPDAPLLGSGSRSIEYKSYQNWPKSHYNSGVDDIFAHNEYLQSLGDYGLVGLLFVLSLLIWHLIIGMKQALWLHRHAPHSRSLAYCIAGLAILVLMALHTTVSFPTHSMSNLMLFALACTFVLPKHSEKKETSSTVLKYKIATVVSAVMLLFSVSYAATQGVKELRAGMVFWKYGIGVEDRNWGPQHQDGDWIPALEQALEISPTYRRFELLGALYLIEATSLDKETHAIEKNQLLEKAEKALSASKALHSEWPATRLNLADTYHQMGEFNKAAREYEEVEYMVEKREEVFSYYRHRARMYRAWAKHFMEQGDIKYAKKYSKLAVKYINVSWKKMLYRMDDALKTELLDSQLVYYRSCLAEEVKDNKRLSESLDAFHGYARLGKQLWVDANALEAHARVLYYQAKLFQAELERGGIFFKRSEVSDRHQFVMNVATLAHKELKRVQALRNGETSSEFKSLLSGVGQLMQYYRSIQVSPDYTYPFSEDSE